MCYSLFAALFSKTFLSHPPFKYPRSAPDAACHGFDSPRQTSFYDFYLFFFLSFLDLRLGLGG